MVWEHNLLQTTEKCPGKVVAPDKLTDTQSLLIHVGHVSNHVLICPTWPGSIETELTNQSPAACHTPLSLMILHVLASTQPLPNRLQAPVIKHFYHPAPYAWTLMCPWIENSLFTCISCTSSQQKQVLWKKKKKCTKHKDSTMLK